jgi:YHS domain-containing protein
MPTSGEAILRPMRKRLTTLIVAALLAALSLVGCDRHDPSKMVDPVCGMDVDPATAAATSVYAGKTYYFCSKDEKELFDKDPKKYLKDG